MVLQLLLGMSGHNHKARHGALGYPIGSIGRYANRNRSLLRLRRIRNLRQQAPLRNRNRFHSLTPDFRNILG